MCGLFVVCQKAEIDLARFDAALGSLSHRGPDALNTLALSPQLVLGHARLAVQELSVAGRQPMFSQCGRFVIVFNGEIYNHLELRKQFFQSIHNWNGHSDTETVIEMISKLGLEKTISFLEGMFAFTVWDRRRDELIVGRDRFGEKPLFMFEDDKVKIFSSEIKAILSYLSKPLKLNSRAFISFLEKGYTVGNDSIFDNIEQVSPGCVSFYSTSTQSLLSTLRYWDSEALATESKSKADIVVDNLQGLLTDALRRSVKQQLLGDVPVGTFLSGGIDSSLVTALAAEQSSKTLKTFCIGFSNSEYDESKFAKSISQYLGTDHHESIMSGCDALEIVRSLPEVYDEPFGDSSAIPTIYLSRLARKHVTVALSGDGGDELFGGYNRYHLGFRVWQKISALPLPFKVCAAHFFRFLSGLGAVSLNKLFYFFEVKDIRGKAFKMSLIIKAKTLTEFYELLISQLIFPETYLNKEFREQLTIDFVSKSALEASQLDSREIMMIKDTVDYLPGDILKKVDRASMSTSLEARSPFLNSEVFRLAWKIPLQHKIMGARGKIPLRQMLAEHIPTSLYENRPKMGFGVPLGEWLKEDFREWTLSCLDSGSLRAQGIFDPESVSMLLKHHLEGTKSNQYGLWNILMMQQWLKKHNSFVTW